MGVTGGESRAPVYAAAPLRCAHPAHPLQRPHPREAGATPPAAAVCVGSRHSRHRVSCICAFGVEVGVAMHLATVVAPTILVVQPSRLHPRCPAAALSSSSSCVCAFGGNFGFSAVGEAKFWVYEFFTVYNLNHGMGVVFGSSLLEIV